MSHASDSRRGTYLPTGWRIVGAGAERIAERAAAAAVQRLEPGPATDTLYALQCTLPPVVRGRNTVERVLAAVTEEIRQTWADCPRLVRDEEAERPPSRFGGLRFDILADPGSEWLGEVVWRSVHPVVAGAPITTRVLLEERPSFTRLSVRVTADDGPTSVRGYVGAGQAQPSFLRALRGEVAITWLGGPFGAHPIGEGRVEDLVLSVLASPERDVPVAVLSPLEEGGYVVDPEDLAWELLGRARLFVLRHHRQTFELSDTVGDRRMSAYWGAARCYMPGWSRHDEPLEHPLLHADRLADPLMRATWLGEIGVWTGRRLELPPTIAERVEVPAEEGEPDEGAATTSSERVEEVQATKPAPAPPAPADAIESRIDGAAAASPPPDPSPLLETLLGEVRGLASVLGDLTDEVERLRTISSLRSSSTNAIERRLGRLEDILDQVFPDGSGLGAAEEAREPAEREGEAEREDEGGPTLVEAVHDAAEVHSDALMFLDSAYDAARQSPYEDPERVRAVLEAMARVARRRRDGVLGTSLREAFADLGIDYRAGIAKSTSARLREQYRFTDPGGNAVEAEEHIALGGTYDPRRCLRIYFSSRVPNEPRFVIGHVGRHFEVMTSS